MSSEVATPAKSEKKERYIKRRKALIELSKIVRMGIDGGEFDTVNEGLKAMYEEEGHEELNTYRQWQEKGFQVLKGSEALLVWGKPRKSQQGPDDEDKEFKFWPLCYLFSNLQVEKRS